MPAETPTNRPPKGQPKPRRWKVARDATRQEKAKPKPRQQSPLQIAQAKDRDKVRKLTKAERQERYQQLQELRTRAVQAGLVEHGLDPIQVLQRLIDDAFIRYLLEQQAYDAYLVENKTPDPRQVQRFETNIRSLARESAYFSGLSVQYNVQERQVRVAEARIVLIMQAMQEALRHPDIDLPPDKVKRLPAIMKERLVALRATSEE